MHRLSITVPINDKWYNIASVVNGKKLSQEKAIAHAAKNKLLGKPFKGVDEAVKAAKERSENYKPNAFKKEKMMPKSAFK